MIPNKDTEQKRKDLMKLDELRYNLSIKYKAPALYNEWFLFPETDEDCKKIADKLNILFRTGKTGIY